MGMACVDDAGGTSCYESFPFVDDFEALVKGEVSYEYLERLATVLSPAIDVAAELVEVEQPLKQMVVTLIYCVAALARVRVAQAYRLEVEAVDVYGYDEVLRAVCFEWTNLTERDNMVFVPYSESVHDVIGASVHELWQLRATTSLLTCDELRTIYGPIVNHLRVLPVGNALIVVERGGSMISQVGESDACKCVLSLTAYRSLIAAVKRLPPEVLVDDVPTRLSDYVASNELHDLHVLFGDKVSDWMWLIQSGMPDFDGYCYQFLVPPRDRLFLTRLLLYEPHVADLLWGLNKMSGKWSKIDAVIDPGSVLHVRAAGNPDLAFLQLHADKRIGTSRVVASQQRDTGDVDYFAQALVDNFVKKHRRVRTLSDSVAPVDPNFEALTIDTATSGTRTFADVGAILYKGVGELLSPRAELAGRSSGVLASTGEHISERDSERVRDLYARLSEGAVISEDYYRRSRKRLVMHRRRPRLGETSGHVYHVFAGFPADGGTGTGPWQLDEDWDVPGWTSYLAVFDKGVSLTVAFVSPDESNDVRMDCSGEGALEFGGCLAHVFDTVLWFTRSVKFKIVTKTEVALRISIPSAGSALAIGSEMRRYMYIPGYSIVARSFDVITGVAEVAVPMERRRGGTVAGCHTYVGNKHVERGRHRFKLSKLASAAPVRMVVKTDPIDALEYVGVCGMRVKPRVRDYVSVLFDVGNVGLYVSLRADAYLCVSTVQVVRVDEFDLTVAGVERGGTYTQRGASVSQG